MKVTTQVPEKEYPYLAVWVGHNEPLGISSIKKIKIDDIVLISLIETKTEDKEHYVQHILGGKKAYTTNNESDYFPLPKGYIINICQ